jgi:Zn-dependent peptidase ImmA (M78 family)
MLEERFRIRIFYWPLGDAGSAASAVGDFGYGIMINSDEAPWRRNFDLAHELFHLITWNVLPSRDISCGTVDLTEGASKKNRPEQYADCFASTLLLPEEHLRTALNNVSTEGRVSDIELVVNLAIDFGVSVEALLWRLKTLRLLKRTQVSKILEADKKTMLKYQRSVRKWDKELPGFTNRYVFMAVRCFQLGLVSKARLAQYLDTDLVDVEETVARYGYTLSEENAFEEADSC